MMPRLKPKQQPNDSSIPLAWFDYQLPVDRIAHHPAEPRDSSRLLAVEPRDGAEHCQHKLFSDLQGFFRPGDLVVVNRTRVFKARLSVSWQGGGQGELFVVRQLAPNDAAIRLQQAGLEGEQWDVWWAMGRPMRKLARQSQVKTIAGECVTVLARLGDGICIAVQRPMQQLLAEQGELPLPPYIARPSGASAQDEERYQTIFAQETGAVAAPTAALHFTEAVVQGLRRCGVEMAELLLHVGPGTFVPVRDEVADDVRAHAMHGEWYSVPDKTQRLVEQTRAAGGRVVAIGTTVVRALESWAGSGQAEGTSELFIYPGYRFAVVDGMVTNFHLPKSTLLMLVAAFCGVERWQRIYQLAIEQRYRFYSYGDAMLVWAPGQEARCD